MIIASSYLQQQTGVSQPSRKQIIGLECWQQPMNLAVCINLQEVKIMVHLEIETR